MTEIEIGNTVQVPNAATAFVYDETGDVVFLWNPRSNQQEVVRNARFGGAWGTEERSGGWPFVTGSEKVKLARVSGGWEVMSL